MVRQRSLLRSLPGWNVVDSSRTDHSTANAGETELGANVDQLFGDGLSDSNLLEFQQESFSEVAFSEQFRSDVQDSASVASVEIVEQLVPEEPDETDVRGQAVAPRQVWNEMVANSFAEHRQTNQMLLYPWETGPMADIFNFNQDPLPRCPGLAEIEQSAPAGAPDESM
eukprot:s1136_g5.t1